MPANGGSWLPARTRCHDTWRENASHDHHMTSHDPLVMDVKGVGQKRDRILVIFDGVEDDGNIAITRCHLWMVLTKHQQNEVSRPKDDDIIMTS